ncbi:MAG TPA: restriction endonuclease [Bryobacteraceae bacterium]|nr:restriction endonuclease [Bryobacteraceae bacterium]
MLEFEQKHNVAAPDAGTVEIVHDFQRILNELSRKPHTLNDLSPRQFEELIAGVLKRFGCEIELTKRTRDGGRDVVAVQRKGLALKFLVECKRYAESRKVDVSIVRALYGVKVSEGATKAILATTSSVTRDATDFVQSHRWELEVRDRNGVIEWVNAARDLRKTNDSPVWVPLIL